MNTKIFKNRNYITIIFSIIIFLTVSITSFLRIPLFTDLSHTINIKIKSSLTTFENKAYLYNPDLFWENEVVNDNIVVITFDEETYDEFWFPISRKEYKPVIEKANLWWAEVIWFDIIFSNHNKLDFEWDEIFAEAIEKAWNVVLWGAIIPRTFDWKVYGIIEKPLDKFLKWAKWFWYYKPTIDPITDIALKFKPEAQFLDVDRNESNYNHFAISLLKAYYWSIYNQDYINYNSGDKNFYYFRPNWAWLPYYQSWKKHVLINYLPLPKPDTGKKSLIKTFSFLDVYKWKIDPEEFKWKIVIIWVTAKWIKDVFYTPNGSEYWVYVLANIVNTILTKNYLIYFNTELEFILIFLLIILSVYFNLSRSWYILIFSNISIILIFLFIFPLYILWFTNYLLNHLFELYLALLFSLSLSNTYKYLSENKSKIKLNKALSEYVSKAIAEEVLSNSWKINLDWEKKHLAIFFSDIEWFTSISEKLNPENLVLFLREYLTKMSDVIMDDKWFINKYEWDAIMALWWSFIDYNKWAYYACLCALKQQETLKELNKKWVEKYWKINVRIWIHVWLAIVWNIGSKWRKMEYTALWDSVNIASRLEGVNKFYGTYICVSSDVYNETKDFFEFRYLDKIRVKWKNKTIKIYELLSLKNELSKIALEKIKIFDEAVELYLSKDFKKAAVIFKSLVKRRDKPSATYLERCEAYIQNSPDDNWDWVWTMDSK